jgi:CRISPR-associated endonuclease Cas2
MACYDIEKDSLRNRISTRLLDIGLERIQFSVYAGPLTDIQRKTLEDWVEKKLENHLNANFLLIPLHQYSIAEGRHIGSAPPDWAYLAGELHTLIL